MSDAPTLSVWSPEDGVRQVLVVTAHPDDVDFGTAGTVAAFTQAGLEVTYCIATNGDAGGSDRAMSRQPTWPPCVSASSGPRRLRWA